MKCLIAGASGLVGGHLLDLLLADSSKIDSVVSVARRALPRSHERLHQVIADFDRLPDVSVAEANGAEVAFCCLGTTIKKAGSQEAFRKVDHDYVIRFAEYAKKAGCKRFLVVSAMGADASSYFFYNRVKGEMERDLAKLGFESVSIFRPSLLLGERSEHRAAEAFAIKIAPIASKLMVGPLAKQRPIEARKVARAMLNSALVESRGVTVIQNDRMF